MMMIMVITMMMWGSWGLCNAGDRCGGRAEGVPCPQGGRRGDQRVTCRTAAALPTNPYAHFRREELDDNLSNSRRTAQEFRQISRHAVMGRHFAANAYATWRAGSPEEPKSYSEHILVNCYCRDKVIPFLSSPIFHPVPLKWASFFLRNSPLNPARGYGEVCKLPQRALGRKRVFVHFPAQKRIWWQWFGLFVMQYN